MTKEFLDTRSKQMGRPSKFTLKLATKIYFLAKKGMTDKEIAYTVDISEDTLNRWKKSEVFKKALDQSKAEVDAKVENALLSRALGKQTKETIFSKDTIPVTDADGKTVYVEKGLKQTVIEKEVLPDTVAAKFWLTNRNPDKWKEKGVNVIADTKILNVNMSDEKIADIIKEKYAERAARIASGIRNAIGLKSETYLTED